MLLSTLMPAFIIPSEASLLTCLDHAATTRALLAADPLTQGLAADFDAWIVEWKAVFLQEIDLRIAGTSAAAVEVAADADLNDLSDETSRTVLVLVKNDRDDPEYRFYYNGERASDFKKPHLGSQLEGMRLWIGHMAASPAPAIVDLGARIAAKVQAADAAVEATATASQKEREFRLTGARRQLVDKLNALRKATYGTLSEMPHKHPDLKLPATYADRFFRAERPTSPSRPPAAASIKVELDAAQKELDRLTKAHGDAVKAEEEAAAARAAQADLQKQLAQAEDDLRHKQAAVAALRAQVAQG